MAIAVVSAIIGRRRRKKESYIYWQPSCPLCRDTPQWLQTRHTHFGLRRNIIYLSFNTSVIHVEAAAARFKEKKKHFVLQRLSSFERVLLPSLIDWLGQGVGKREKRRTVPNGLQ